MLSFLPAPVIFIFNFIMLSICTAVISLLIIFTGIFRIFRNRSINNVTDSINQFLYRIWVNFNAFLIRLTTGTEWDIQGFDELKPVKGSCIIISNHISWTDIVMICHLYRGKIPIPKFFMKHSLIYIPFVGQVCYSLGMPFLKRYTREQLLKNPELKSKDLETTRKACRAILHHPSALINFVEGTRYSEEKAKRSKSPYKHLMPPKAASLGVALGITGKKVDCLLNTTIQYPGTEGNLFFALLSGRLKKVIARTELMEITDDMIGDYTEDKQFKNAFTMKLRRIWVQKDELIDRLLTDEPLLQQKKDEGKSTEKDEDRSSEKKTEPDELKTEEPAEENKDITKKNAESTVKNDPAQTKEEQDDRQ